MRPTTGIAVALLTGLPSLAVAVIALVVLTPLPWWGGLALLLALDGALLLWARRRLKAIARGEPLPGPPHSCGEGV